MNRIVISEIGSERATVGDGNKMVWQDISRAGYLNQVRTLDTGTEMWSSPVTLGHGLDNHARPILTVDTEGFLHVVLGGHNSPVTWLRSARSNDSSEWSDPSPIGEGTYPVLICGPDDTLYLTLRANNHAGVDFYAKPKDGPWELRSRIVKNAEEYRAAYAGFHMQMMMGTDEVIQAVIDFYEGQDEVGRGLHQAVCYVKSEDGGRSWLKADGSAVDAPARPEGMDVLARSTETRVEELPRPEIANVGMLVDSRNRGHILYLSHENAPGELFIVTIDAQGQARTPIHPDIESAWPDMRVTDARATIDSEDTITILATLSAYNDEWIDNRPSRAMNMVERKDQRLVMISTKDFGVTCEVQSLVDPGTSVNAANLETPVGANRLVGGTMPTFVYFEGSKGYPGGDTYYNKPVEEMLAAGEFWENLVVLRR
jgi:hypothetical protein